MSASDMKSLQGFLQLMSGFEANRQERIEAKAIRKQGARALEEAREDARRQRIEGRKFGARQKLAFLKSGVSLEGSPLLALAETKKEISTRSDRIESAGGSRFQFARTKAKLGRARGRSAMIGSSAQAAGSFSEAQTLAQEGK